LLNLSDTASTSISEEGTNVRKIKSAFPAKLCNPDFNSYLKPDIYLHNFLLS